MKVIPNERTQCWKVMQHLKMTGNITGIQALHLFKVRDLPKRISELRQMGAVIEGQWKVDTTGARYKAYYLVAQKRA